MKHLIKISKRVAILICLGMSTLVSANDDPVIEPIKEVREKIVKLIDNPLLSDASAREMESTLHFMINSKDELVVLLVETEYDFVDQYLKDRLNYKKVTTLNVRGQYAMKITIKNGSK